MFNMRAKNQGFSLIELMLTIAVLSVIAVMGVPAYQATVGNSQIRTVAQSIKNGMQLARVEAIKRNTKIKFTLASDTSWQIGCNTVTADCAAVLQSKSAKEGASPTIALTLTGSSSVVFNSFGMRDASVASPLSQVDIDNSKVSSGDKRKLRVLLNTGGEAKVCDPLVTTDGDPRKC